MSSPGTGDKPWATVHSVQLTAFCQFMDSYSYWAVGALASNIDHSNADTFLFTCKALKTFLITEPNFAKYNISMPPKYMSGLER